MVAHARPRAAPIVRSRVSLNGSASRSYVIEKRRGDVGTTFVLVEATTSPPLGSESEAARVERPLRGFFLNG